MRLKNLKARNVDKIKTPQSPWEPHAKSCQNKQSKDVSCIVNMQFLYLWLSLLYVDLRMFLYVWQFTISGSLPFKMDPSPYPDQARRLIEYICIVTTLHYFMVRLTDQKTIFGRPTNQTGGRLHLRLFNLHLKYNWVLLFGFQCTICWSCRLVAK